MKFTESQLEHAFVSLLQDEQMVHQIGNVARQTATNIIEEPVVVYGYIISDKVLIDEDLKIYLSLAYAKDGITENKIESILRDLDRLTSSDLYESNKTFI